MLLNVTYGNPSQFSRGFPQNTTLGELRLHIAEITEIPVDHMELTRIISKGKKGCATLFETGTVCIARICEILETLCYEMKSQISLESCNFPYCSSKSSPLKAAESNSKITVIS